MWHCIKKEYGGCETMFEKLLTLVLVKALAIGGTFVQINPSTFRPWNLRNSTVITYVIAILNVNAPYDTFDNLDKTATLVEDDSSLNYEINSRHIVAKVVTNTKSRGISTAFCVCSN
jgi:hypothetical protein